MEGKVRPAWSGLAWAAGLIAVSVGVGLAGAGLGEAPMILICVGLLIIVPVLVACVIAVVTWLCTDASSPVDDTDREIAEALARALATRYQLPYPLVEVRPADDPAVDLSDLFELPSWRAGGAADGA